jgi:hypothetical protein
VTALRDVDSAVERLDEALRAAGTTGLEAPSDIASIADVVEEVTPYVLPPELRQFWERVDPESVHVRTFPMIGGPATALAELRMARELATPVPIGLPPILLPVDYASHCYGVVELASEWAEGGSLLEYAFDDMPFVSHGVADWIELLAELLEEGSFELHDGWAELDHPAVLAKRLTRLEASGRHHVYGDLREIPDQLQLWPAHWLAASGIDLRDREPLGATHTIAELVAAAAEGRVTGRIHGVVTRLVGSGDGARVVVDDGSSPLDVWCPAGTSAWGPVHRTRFEFEVTIDGPVGAPPDLDSPHEQATRHALAGDLESAQAAVLDLLGELDRHRAAAVASDIRPLD